MRGSLLQYIKSSLGKRERGQLPVGQLTAIHKELLINSKYKSKYNFSVILYLILSSMQFVVLISRFSRFWWFGILLF
jgi:hypothetical protein